MALLGTKRSRPKRYFDWFAHWRKRRLLREHDCPEAPWQEYRTGLGIANLPHDQLLALGRKLQLRKQVRVLDGAARALVFAVPVIHARFRHKLASQGLHYRQDEGPPVDPQFSHRLKQT